MFAYATSFNQDMSGRDLSKIRHKNYMMSIFSHSGFCSQDKPAAFLLSWSLDDRIIEKRETYTTATATNHI